MPSGAEGSITRTGSIEGRKMILQEIQQKLKAPKNQRNNFGGYNYRSCEDIVEALKPILSEYGAAIILSDEIVEAGGRVYVKATATLKSDKDSISVTAFAREPEMKKGMDESQITGAASSYARKYALNGLFGIDDTKDADACDNRESAPKANPDIIKQINGCKTQNALAALFAMITPAEQTQYKAAFSKRKVELANANH